MASSPVPQAGDDAYPEASLARPWWKAAMAGIAAFSLLSLWNLPETIRPAFLTTGALAAGLFGLQALVAHGRAHPRLLGFALVLIGYWLFAFPPVVNGMDDNSAYLIFARDFYWSLELSLQPLSERRLFSVGGLYAFQAPVLHWMGTRGLALVEPGLGLLMMFAIVAARAQGRGATGPIMAMALAGMAPLAGSLVAANSSSVFTLAAFSLACLEIARDALRSGRVRLSDLVLLLLIMLVAALFRPTTAPFHLALLGLLALLVFASDRALPGKLAAGCALLAPAAFLALVPYEAAFGSWLYPLLGKGQHVSADGATILASLTPAAHLGNVAALLFANPMPILAVALAVLAWLHHREPGARRFIAVALAAFVAFALAIVLTTGGEAATRYIFPVFLALAMSQILTIDLAALAGRWKRTKIGGDMAGWLLIGATALLLATAWLLAGERVWKNRLGYHHHMSAKAGEIDRLRQIVADAPGHVLIIYIGDERLLLEPIRSGYFIMDLPGMIFPAPDRSLSYEAALRQFIARHRISTILYPHDTCDPARRRIYGDSAWHRQLEEQGRINARAICAIAGEREPLRVGDVLVLRL